MFEHPLQGVGFVVDGEPINDGRAGFVKADDFDLGSFAAEFQHHFVERTHGGEIPEMRVAHVDAHLGDRLLEIERGEKLRR